jgi:hypothetical protein
MKSGSSFLLAARQCEIAELEQLARTGELVGGIGRFIHALQRERGMSNIFLSSNGRRFGDQRVLQVAECTAVELQVRAVLDQLDTDASQVRNGSRLFSRVAVVLHGLEGLAAHRARIADRKLSAADATIAFTRIISGLLALVFEAADSATDPEVSRALVAMFNFQQGKEFAGQERALGSRGFAAGRIDLAEQQQWRHLIESQQASFQAFADFSDPEVLRADRASRDPEVLADLERMRRIGCSARGGELDANLSQDWYEAATRRIDAMREVEDLLATHLQNLCEGRIAQARAELQDQRVALEALSTEAGDPTGPAPYGPQLERSILGMVQEQSRRLQAMSDELDAVRATLNERKVVERAKGLLMAHRHMSEDEAYKALRQMAMNQNRRLIDVANAVLSLADVLPGGR